ARDRLAPGFRSGCESCSVGGFRSAGRAGRMVIEIPRAEQDHFLRAAFAAVGGDVPRGTVLVGARRRREVSPGTFQTLPPGSRVEPITPTEWRHSSADLCSTWNVGRRHSNTHQRSTWNVPALGPPRTHSLTLAVRQLSR